MIVFYIFCPQLCALLEHNVGQVGGLEEDLGTHHYERISTAVSCRDEDRWRRVDSGSSLSANPWCRCRSGRCLDPGMRCDGSFDCADRGDEEGCGQVPGWMLPNQCVG